MSILVALLVDKYQALRSSYHLLHGCNSARPLQITKRAARKGQAAGRPAELMGDSSALAAAAFWLPRWREGTRAGGATMLYTLLGAVGGAALGIFLGIFVRQNFGGRAEDFAPLICGAAGAIVGAVGGAAQAIVDAVRRWGLRQTQSPSQDARPR
jgi:hypothetical protein